MFVADALLISTVLGVVRIGDSFHQGNNMRMRNSPSSREIATRMAIDRGEAIMLNLDRPACLPDATRSL